MEEIYMAIGILIKRIVKDGIDAKSLLPYIVDLRALAVRQDGYISGETFFNLKRREECLVISRWTSLEHWQRWEKDQQRIDINNEMEKQLRCRSEYNIYGVGLW
jgi:heme-degrading monooxygenase HmoA